MLFWRVIFLPGSGLASSTGASSSSTSSARDVGLRQVLLHLDLVRHRAAVRASGAAPAQRRAAWTGAAAAWRASREGSQAEGGRPQQLARYASSASAWVTVPDGGGGGHTTRPRHAGAQLRWKVTSAEPRATALGLTHSLTQAQAQILLASPSAEVVLEHRTEWWAARSTVYTSGCYSETIEEKAFVSSSLGRQPPPPPLLRSSGLFHTAASASSTHTLLPQPPGSRESRASPRASPSSPSRPASVSASTTPAAQVDIDDDEEEDVYLPEERPTVEEDIVKKERPKVDLAAPPSSTPQPTYTEDRGMDTIQIHTTKTDDRQVSIFAQPGILAAFIGGAVVGLLCAILLVMFIVYRMRKKDEGSYPLDEPKRMPLTSSYSPNDKEIYA
nr:syndecan-3-like [Penaeus vannamei]